MSVRRWHRSVVAAFGLAVLLLSLFAAQAQSGPLAQGVIRPYKAYFPITFVTGLVTLQGTVTNNNAAASGQTIVAMVSRDSGVTYSQAGSAVTSATGSYQIPVTVNDVTDRFYAVWKNANNDDSRLWSFTCNEQTVNSSSHTCDFDIRNVALVSPTPGEHVSFPLTFIWRPRSFTNDNYAVTIYNDDAGKTLKARSDYVGYTDRVTMAVAPPNSSTGVRYYWSVRIQTPYGLGDAYWLNAVYYNDLTSPGINGSTGPAWAADKGSAPAGERTR